MALAHQLQRNCHRVPPSGQRPCYGKSASTPCKLTRPGLRSVVARTSAHWWEDEEEFDGVGGEVLLPKTLHVLALPASDSAEVASAAVHVLRQSQMPEPTAGFCSPKTETTAQQVWKGLGASKPPYFKKMRTRESLALESSEAADHAMTELLGQNWRVELDYGLQGKELAPSEHLLLVTQIQEANSLLQAVGAADTVSQTAKPQLVQIQIRGWNTPDQPQDGGKSLDSWKQLLPVSVCKPTVQPVASA